MSMIAIEENSDPKMLAPSNETERVLCRVEYAKDYLEIVTREISDGKQNWREGLLYLIHREENEHTILDDIAEPENF